MSSDLICEVCKSPSSDVPNHIVICDRCDKGYHQLCHTPQIPSEILVPDLEWICRYCFLSMDIQEKKRFGILRDDQEVESTDHSRPCSSSSSCSSNEEKELTETEHGGLANLIASQLDDNRDSDTVVRKFPYNLKRLEWDAEHLTNTSNIYCYCARGVEYCRSMLQCCSCKQWFHTFCIKSLQSELLIGDQYFKLICSVCADDGQESCKRITMKWSAVVGLALSNLTYGSKERFFSVERHILPFLVENENLFKLSHSLDKLSRSELAKKISNHLFENSPTKFISNECGEWSLNVKWPYDDPLTFSPFTSNLESTMAIQKERQREFEENQKKLVKSGACRKAASPNQSVKTKSKKTKSVKRASDQTSLSNWKKPRNRNSEPGPPEKVEILDFNTAIPFPENWAGKNNPFYLPVSNSDSDSNSGMSSANSVNSSGQVRSEPADGESTNNHDAARLDSRKQRLRKLSTSSDTAEYRVVNCKDTNKLVLSRVNSVNNSLNLENNHSLNNHSLSNSLKANSPSSLSKNPLISSSANGLPINNHTNSSADRSNSSTNSSNFLSQKTNGHMPDGKPDSKLDGKLDGKLDDKLDGKLDGKTDGKLDGKLDSKLDDNLDRKPDNDKRTDLNGAVNGSREEVNSKSDCGAFKLLGQRKTFNGGLEFMIECTEKE